MGKRLIFINRVMKSVTIHNSFSCYVWTIVLFGILPFMGCNISNINNGKETAYTWELPKGDLNMLPEVDYAALTQLYDNDMLVNRDVTFRDERLLTMRSLRSIYHETSGYKTAKEWEQRRDYLKKQILVSAGLWPMPDKTPLSPKYYQKVEHSDYVVETVTIETYPGFFLSGNLYRPKGEGPFPAILTPHGHFKYGRLNDDHIQSVPARSINFAKQGYVVFAYDMVGYNDTRQASHSFANDSISELYGINLLGLQLWNSIRALDYLTDLAQVDDDRIGITGASGGGTQVFLLTGVDDRFHVTAPVNMVSDHMQGGDLCENAPGLRTNAYNVEFGAMVAPKPLLLVSNTYDWTYTTRNTIFPAIESVYGFYQSEDMVKSAHFDYVHNYNKASREAVYKWFGKWLLNEQDETKFKEQPYEVDSDQNLLAFMNERNDDLTKTFQELSTTEYHDGPQLTESGLKALLKDIYAKQLAGNWPKDLESLEQFRSLYGPAMQHMTGTIVPEAIESKIIGSAKSENFTVYRILIARKGKNDWIPCVLYQPLSIVSSTVILTADNGKSHWVNEGSSAPSDIILKLLDQKRSVLVPDLFKQGEHVLQDSTKTVRNENVEYFTTYNPTDRQEQIQDLLTIVSAIRENKDLSQKIDLYTTGNTGLTGLFASILTDHLDRIVIDGNDFDPTTDQNMLTLQIPGIMRIGGLKTVLVLAANRNILLYNANPSLVSPEIIEASKLGDNKKGLSMILDNVSVDELLDFIVK